MMKAIIIGLKLFGIFLFTRTISAIVNLLSFLFSPPPFPAGAYNLMQATFILIYAAFSVLFIAAPKWLTKLVGNKTEDISFSGFSVTELIHVGITLIGVVLFVTSLINLFSFTVKYALAINGQNTTLLSETRSSVINQIDSAVSLVVGFILIRGAASIEKLLHVEMKKDS